MDRRARANSAENDRRLIDEFTNIDGAVLKDHGNFSAIAADGKVLTGNVGVYVKQGTLPNGNAAFGSGNVCIFRYEQEKVAQVG